MQTNLFPGFIILTDVQSKDLENVSSRSDHWFAVRPEHIIAIEPTRHEDRLTIYITRHGSNDMRTVLRDELLAKLNPAPPTHQLTITQIERSSTRSGSRMWRMKTAGGEQVNVFGPDSSNSNFELLTPEWADYLEDIGTDAYLAPHAVVTVTKDGQWNKLVSIDSPAPPITSPDDEDDAPILDRIMNKLDQAQHPDESMTDLKDRLGSLHDVIPPPDLLTVGLQLTLDSGEVATVTAYESNPDGSPARVRITKPNPAAPGTTKVTTWMKWGTFVGHLPADHPWRDTPPKVRAVQPDDFTLPDDEF